MGKNSIIFLTVIFILIGLCVSYLIRYSDWWDRYYFTWDKGKDLLLVWCVILNCRVKVICDSLKALFYFLIIRLLWEAFAIPNYRIASKTEVIDILFTIDLFVILIIIFMAFKPYKKL